LIRAWALHRLVPFSVVAGVSALGGGLIGTVIESKRSKKKDEEESKRHAEELRGSARTVAGRPTTMHSESTWIESAKTRLTICGLGQRMAQQQLTSYESSSA
jgi:hypothetical protein